MRRTALALLLSTAPIAAQALTADELLAVQNEMVARMGLTPAGRIDRSEGALRMVDAGARAALPFDWGEIAWAFGPIPLTEEGGDVLQHWDDGITVTFEYRPRPGGVKPGMKDPRYSATFTLSGSDVTSRASGTLDAVEITTTAAQLDMALTGLSGFEPAATLTGNTLAITLQDWANTLTLTGFTPANTATARMESRDSAALIATRYNFGDGEFLENGASAQEGVSNSMVLDLPAAGSTTGLGAALRAGLAFRLDTASQSGQSDGTTRDSIGTSRYRQTTGETTSHLGVDAVAGLVVGAKLADLAMTVEDAQMGPEALAVTLEGAMFDLAAPFMANGAREKSHLSFDIVNLRGLTDSLWFADLPEAFAAEPFTFAITLGADYEPLVDLTDIGGFFDMIEIPDILRIYDFGIDALDTGYAEARLTGAGRLSFGLYGAILNDDIPNPKGQATFTLSGAYALLNRLGQAGAVPPEFLTMARGAVAAFGQAKGPDAVESTIGLGPNGFTVNGAPAPF